MTGETPLGEMGCGLIAGLAVGMMVMDEIERNGMSKVML